MITVYDLIKQLQTLDPKAYIILQKDSEGNGYSPLAGAEAGKYLPDNTWCGEVMHPNDIEELDKKDKKKLISCVVLWPIN